MMAPAKEDEDETLHQRHLDWTAKQGRILTANGRATELYSAERGFAFDERDLPHYHLLQNDTSFSFFIPQKESSIICGAWSRSYFVGGWEHSCWHEETVYNVQTNSLFVDLRIPTSRSHVLPLTATSLQEYSNQELSYYARQHVFAGLSVVSTEEERPVCVRHHVLDWNFVGTPRPRPNKWWIESMLNSSSENKSGMVESKWKEWAYATDEYGQHYYCEQWERLKGGSGISLALRKERLDNDDEDGIIVVVGNHFNYIQGRALATTTKPQYENQASLVTLVDAALDANDRDTALEWLGRIRGGHGRITCNGEWVIDCAIQPWKEGTVLFDRNEVVLVEGSDMSDLASYRKEFRPCYRPSSVTEHYCQTPFRTIMRTKRNVTMQYCITTFHDDSHLVGLLSYGGSCGLKGRSE
jgi:hypothetical protein